METNRSINNETKVYIVPINGDIEATFSGYVDIYATSSAEAVAKVQAKIDAETLDSDLEMTDAYSGYTMSYGEVADQFGAAIEIVESEIEVDEDVEVYPADVLEDEIQQLHSIIEWDVEKQAKLKAFLEKWTDMEGAIV